jgi:hypothetical protein
MPVASTIKLAIGTTDLNRVLRRAHQAHGLVGWRHLADPALTSFDRREIRNYMKEAELALAAGLKRLADREQARRDAEVASNIKKRLDFRILQLDP